MDVDNCFECEGIIPVKKVDITSPINSNID